MTKTRAELGEQYHNDMMALAEAYENRLALIVTAQCAEIIAGDLPKKCPLCGAEPPVGDAALSAPATGWTVCRVDGCENKVPSSVTDGYCVRHEGDFNVEHPSGDAPRTPDDAE